MQRQMTVRDALFKRNCAQEIKICNSHLVRDVSCPTQVLTRTEN
jgi:hypothetical protein